MRFEGSIEEILWKFHHGLDEIGQALKLAIGQPDTKVVAEIGDGEVTIRTPEAAARANSDRLILTLARFMATNNWPEDLLGQHIAVSWEIEVPFYAEPTQTAVKNWRQGQKHVGTGYQGTIRSLDKDEMQVIPDDELGLIYTLHLDLLLAATGLEITPNKIPLIREPETG